MPIYEYVCMKCNERFSLIQSMNSAKDETKCPKCGVTEVKKLVSSFCCSTGFGSGASSIPSGGFTGGG